MAVHRYREVADRIIHLIENGVLKEGEKIPSLRQLSHELQVSVNTVREAYWRLEDSHMIEAVPQSGYYVKNTEELELKVRHKDDPQTMNPQEVSLCRVYGSYQQDQDIPPEISLGIATINPENWPVEKLSRYFIEAFRNNGNEALDYLMAPGYAPLREQIARHALASGTELSPDEIIITNGCHEAVFLSLMTICSTGDTIAIESPVYFNFLQMLEALGLNVIEIPSTPDEGINLDILKYITENHDIKAIFIISNFSNPTGATLPDERKRELEEWSREKNIPIIEDDIYGDLSFSNRPRTIKSFDNKGNTILCSSFSKTLSPGLRLGWVIPGRYYDEILRMKTLLNIGTCSLNQIAVSTFLKEGGYERYIRHMRRDLKEKMESGRNHILKSFPRGTEVTRPQGGFVLWVELPDDINTLELYYMALKEDILIAPGCLFSLQEKFCNCLRLNVGYWNPRVERAVTRLGELIKSM